MLDNININRFQGLIRPVNIGVGSKSNKLMFSSELGPTNHVVIEAVSVNNAVAVEVEKLDNIAQEATMIKIDVEGFESEVINGAGDLLRSTALVAILIELNGLGVRYDFKDDDIHDQLLNYGFIPVYYDPVSRSVVELDHHNITGNTLYVRKSSELETRLANAKPVYWEERVIA